MSRLKLNKPALMIVAVLMVFLATSSCSSPQKTPGITPTSPPEALPEVSPESMPPTPAPEPTPKPQPIIIPLPESLSADKWESTNGPSGATVHSLAVDPTMPDIVYAGLQDGGICRSTDGGKTWREHNVGWTNDGVFSLVFHPEDTNIIYAGTYNGVNRSIDGGEHWEMWDNGWPLEQWVFSIDFDPRAPDVMYACSKNGENMGRGREGFRGTVMKSTDGGASWFEITAGLNINQEFYNVIVDPISPDTLYLATQGDGVFISHDGGEHWVPWNEGLTNLTAGTNGNNVTNVLTLSADGKVIYFGTSGSGVWRRGLHR